ncbi:MAG: hypothetical protein IGS50_08615 [Synechococcales cyanobacterium C42_A2020_086]|jgi:hypothetical protein|nr:hypothetical protein [Synechococcales cyanobacterium M58_A2018_015]MBF2073811.1 hypothetical protein [Synechococcales cyanobacterium C42_A2020_086]
MPNSDLRSPAVLLPGFSRLALPLIMSLATAVPAVALDLSPGTYYNPRPFRASERDYDRCAAALQRAGLDEAAVADACAAALHPQELAQCVTAINGNTELAAADVLSGCRRVRRPQELASCVVSINRISSEGTAELDVLNNCRRSLLPIRFSNCVVGLSRQLTASTSEAMSDCIAASSRPRDVLPTFIPQGQPVPLQPLPGTELTPVQPPVDSGTVEPAPTTPTQTVPALW